MNEFKFPQKLVNLVSISIMETIIEIKGENMKSDPVTVKSNLRQGDFMSPIQFNLILEKIRRKLRIEIRNKTPKLSC